MASAVPLSFVIFVLVSFSVHSMLLLLFRPWLPSRSQIDARLALTVKGGVGATTGGSAGREAARKRVVEEALRELEEKRRAAARKRGRPTLISRMRQGGLGWSRSTYVGICVACGLAVFVVVALFGGLGPLAAAGFALAGGLLLPHLYVSRCRTARLRKFSEEFAQAVDVVVRGVRSGLPLVDCLKIVAAESQQPVRGEFRKMVEDQTLGMPIDDAVEGLAERVPVPETNFFAIVIAIQSRTGGSLSEALGNLSKVLRDRKKMQAKIRAMSAEAKASAGIIGSLPVVVAGLLYLTSPEYIGLLFSTLTGNIVLVVSGMWMLLGIMVMRKMINFDF